MWGAFLRAGAKFLIMGLFASALAAILGEMTGVIVLPNGDVPEFVAWIESFNQYFVFLGLAAILVTLIGRAVTEGKTGGF